MIHFVTGDRFDVGAYIEATAVNCVGVVGAEDGPWRPSGSFQERLPTEGHSRKSASLADSGEPTFFNRAPVDERRSTCRRDTLRWGCWMRPAGAAGRASDSRVAAARARRSGLDSFCIATSAPQNTACDRSERGTSGSGRHVQDMGKRCHVKC